jgi:hypothetical protein
MTISIYDAALKFAKTETAEGLIENINRIAKVDRNGVMEGLFVPLVPHYPPEELKAIIMYAMYAYSEQSDACISGVSMDGQRRSIAAHVQLAESLHKEIIYLQKKEFRIIVLEYLEIQRNRDWTHYQNKLTQYNTLTSASVRDMFSDDGKVNFKLILDMNNMCNELLTDIKKYEGEYKSRYGFVEDANEEIKNIVQEEDRKVSSLSIENSRSIASNR